MNQHFKGKTTSTTPRVHQQECVTFILTVVVQTMFSPCGITLDWSVTPSTWWYHSLVLCKLQYHCHMCKGCLTSAQEQCGVDAPFHSLHKTISQLSVTTRPDSIGNQVWHHLGRGVVVVHYYYEGYTLLKFNGTASRLKMLKCVTELTWTLKWPEAPPSPNPTPHLPPKS